MPAVLGEQHKSCDDDHRSKGKDVFSATGHDGASAGLGPSGGFALIRLTVSLAALRAANSVGASAKDG